MSTPYEVEISIRPNKWRHHWIRIFRLPEDEHTDQDDADDQQTQCDRRFPPICRAEARAWLSIYILFNTEDVCPTYVMPAASMPVPNRVRTAPSQSNVLPN